MIIFNDNSILKQYGAMSLIEHSLITTVYNLMTEWGVHCVSCDPY